MKLMTKELAAIIPKLYNTESEDDPTVYAKYFTPDGAATWLVLEYDGENSFFGFVSLGDPNYAELGYFDLRELEEGRGVLGLPIERDLFWEVKLLSKAKAEIGC